MKTKRSYCLESAVLIGLSFAFLSCSGGYVNKTASARQDYDGGQCAEAAKKLETSAHQESKDQLLYLLDRGTALQCAGQYEDSIKDFLLADKIAEISDYTSLSKEALTLLTSDEIKHYKGEEFEYVLISQFLALNYLMLGQYEDALVECRRVNHKLDMLVSQGGRHYKQNAMALYLSAMIYETQGLYDHAYIDYKHVYELNPELPYLKADLYRMALKNRLYDDVDRWIEKFHISTDERKAMLKESDLPEVVLIVMNGHAPKKEPDPNWQAIPKFYPRDNPLSHVALTYEQQNARSYELYDVEQVAIQNLDEKWSGILAKKIAGIVAKEVVADQVGKKTDPLIGFLLKVGLYASDRADTRSWLTLPHDFQVLRVRLPGPGDFSLKIQSVDFTGAVRSTQEKLVHIPERERHSVHIFLPLKI